jgi:dolichol-phosphate mannosyltransferase
VSQSNTKVMTDSAVSGGAPSPSNHPVAPANPAIAAGMPATRLGPAQPPAGAAELSIVVPLFNEAENVLPLASRILASFKEETRPIEVILVDDCSTDNTWDQILAAQRSHRSVRALKHRSRSGQSAALWSGFLAARGAIICTLDGDLQNDPADLPGMLALLAECDLVCGVRTERKDNGLRRISTRVARWARRAALGVDFRDTGCNLRVFKRSVLQKVFPFDGLHRFMPVLAHVGGAIVREVPVAHQPRTAGKSKYGLGNRLFRGIFDLAAIAWYRKRQILRAEAFEHARPSEVDRGRQT